VAVNLDESAARALDTVTGLLAAADHARTEVVSVHEKVEHISERIEAEWSLVRERARALLEHVVNEDQQLVAAVAESNRALDELRSVFDQLEEEAPAEMAEAQDEFDELAETVGNVEPLLAEAMEESETIEASLQAKVDEVEAELNRATSQAEELLAQVLLGELKELEAEAERETVELNAYFAGQCLPAIAAKSQELYELLVQVEEDVRLALTAAGDDTEAMTEQTMRDATVRYDEELEDLDGLGKNVERALGELRDFVEAGMERVEDHNDRWNEGIRNSQRGLKEAFEALKEIEDYLRRFAFMR
jgi:chromosome segregation ATPase